MISREEMFLPILEVSEGFKLIWDEFLVDWKDDRELPQYLVLGDLAKYISRLISEPADKELRAAGKKFYPKLKL